VVATGNTVETCLQNLSASRKHHTKKGGKLSTEPCLGNNNNNDENMVYVNVDPGGGRFDSSTATLELPAGATVVRAFLYWAADLSCGVNRPCGSTTPAQQNAPGGNSVSNNTLYKTVQMKVGGGAYSTIDATAAGRYGAWADVPSWYSQPGNAPGDAYQVRADVTPEISAALLTRARRTARGQDTLPITVANVQAGTGYNRYGGWNLVVVWETPTAPWRDVTLFDGFAFVQVQAGQQLVVGPLDFTGFQTPHSGPVDAQVTVWATEGDRFITGDYMSLGGLTSSCSTLTPQTDGLHPSNNFFNSTISPNGQPAGGRTPDYDNQLGFDLATLAPPEGTIPNDATGASVCLGTDGDTYFFGGIAFSTLIQAPNLQITKTASVPSASPGDVVDYTTTVTNPSTRPPDDPLSGTPVDAATNLTVADPLPSGLDFVGFTNNPGDTCAYDAATRTINCRVGTLEPDATFTFTYSANVDAVAQGSSSSPLINYACYASNSIDQPNTIFTGCANASVIVPPAPPEPADLGVVKTVSASNVAPGDNVTWNIVATNYGPATSTGFVLADQLPARVGFVSATASSSLTCTYPAVGSSGAITCTAPSIPARPAAGSSVTLTVVTSVPATTPDGTVLTNVATVNGDQPEPTPDPHPNRDTASTFVVTPSNPVPPNPTPEPTPQPPIPPVPPVKPEFIPGGPAGTRIALHKIASPRSASRGQTVAFTLLLRNIGEASALDVRVCDTPPPGLQIMASGGFHPSGRAVCTTLKKLNVLAVKTFHLKALVTSGSPGLRTNRAKATSSNTPAAHASAKIRILAPIPLGRG
jgi:uncharacterized repeat protein (TIGR01451 family)